MTRSEGQAVGRKRIAWLMRAAGIVGVSRRRAVITTRRDRDARPAPDLVDRNFTAGRPNQLWVADITYVPTAAGFLYLAVVLYAFSRRIVGWAMETHLRTELAPISRHGCSGRASFITAVRSLDRILDEAKLFLAVRDKLDGRARSGPRTYRPLRERLAD